MCIIKLYVIKNSEHKKLCVIKESLKFCTCLHSLEYQELNLFVNDQIDSISNYSQNYLKFQNIL